MAIYVIGDVQGCYQELRRLLKKVEFDKKRDQLWFAGDLVSRGPESLEVLRFVKGLGNRAVTVLGNHDLHLLALQAGIKPLKPGDSLEPVFKATDSAELLDWLRHQPLLHHDTERGYLLTHAGVYPWWSLAEAKSHAAEVEAVLQSEQRHDYFTYMYGDLPSRWLENLSGVMRWRFITNSFTRMRFCTADGNLDMLEKKGPGEQAKGLIPWYELPNRSVADGVQLIFGHWAALTPSLPLKVKKIYPTDTACVWGGKLTALKLRKDKKPERISVKCAGFKVPSG